MMYTRTFLKMVVFLVSLVFMMDAKAQVDLEVDTLTTDLVVSNPPPQFDGDLVLGDASLIFNDDSPSVRFDGNTPQSILGQGSITVQGGGAASLFISELTLGAGISLDVEGRFSRISGSRFVNEGTVRSSSANTTEFSFGTTTDFLVDDFLNRGFIDVGGQLLIGRNDDSILRNEGTILLRENSRLVLGGTFTQDDLGTIIDQGASAVTLIGIIDNTGDVLMNDELGFGGPILINGGEIRGGRLVSASGSSLQFVNPGILDGVTLGSPFNFGLEDTFPRITIQNGLALDNVPLELFEGTSLNFFGSEPQTLGGTGTIFVQSRPNTGAFVTITGDNLTIDSGITIRNGGLENRNLDIVFEDNQGTIIAEGTDSRVTIGEFRSNQRFTNNGLIQVTDGLLRFAGDYSVQDLGEIDFQGGAIELAGTLLNQGQVLRQDASTGVYQIRGTVEGGRLETADGVVADVAGNFNNVTLAGDANLFDNTASSADGSLRIEGSLTFDDATLTINDSAELAIAETVSLTGNGDIFLNGTPENSRIQTFTGSEVVIGSDIAVRTGPTGGGTISRSSLPVINQGTISAETSGQRLVVDGTLQNTGRLQAINSSTLQIDVDNFANEGQLHVDNGTALINSSSFLNTLDGEVSGSGLITLTTSEFFNDGVISPGDSAGDMIGTLLIFGDLNLQSTSVLELDIGGTSILDFDNILVGSEAIAFQSSLGGLLDVSLIEGFTLEANQEFIFLNLEGSVTGEFANLAEGGLVDQFGNIDLFITYSAGDGNDVALFTTASVPEPGAGLLFMILGGAALGARKRKLL